MLCLPDNVRASAESLILEVSATGRFSSGFMTMAVKKNLPKHKTAKVLIKPFFAEIGEAVHRWNALHENLGSLFSAIMQPKLPHPRVAHAIWYELANDRVQRQVLKSAALTKYWKEGLPQHDRIRGEVKWLISEIDSLSDKRNDLVHAPLTVKSQYRIQAGLSFQLESRYVQPSDWYGHGRAKKLVAKGLVGSQLRARYKLTSHWAHELGSFAAKLADHLNGLTKTWPSRPQPPNWGQTKLD